MTLIAFAEDKIITDRAATSGVISRTIDRKVQRLSPHVLVAMAGAALTNAELACLEPFIPQIVHAVTPLDCFDLHEEIEKIFEKSEVDTTLMLTTPTHHILLELGSGAHAFHILTRSECNDFPLAIGSGALQFIHNFELTKDLVGSAIAATLADPHCGRDILSIDISELGKDVPIPAYTPKPRVKEEPKVHRKMPFGALPFPLPVPSK